MRAPLSDFRVLAPVNFPRVSPKPPEPLPDRMWMPPSLYPSSNIADAVTGHVAGTQDCRVPRTHVSHVLGRGQGALLGARDEVQVAVLVQPDQVGLAVAVQVTGGRDRGVARPVAAREPLRSSELAAAQSAHQPESTVRVGPRDDVAATVTVPVSCGDHGLGRLERGGRCNPSRPHVSVAGPGVHLRGAGARQPAQDVALAVPGDVTDGADQVHLVPAAARGDLGAVTRLAAVGQDAHLARGVHEREVGVDARVEVPRPRERHGLRLRLGRERSLRGRGERSGRRFRRGLRGVRLRAVLDALRRPTDVRDLCVEIATWAGGLPDVTVTVDRVEVTVLHVDPGVVRPDVVERELPGEELGVGIGDPRTAAT